LVVCSNLTKSIFAKLFAPTANDKSIKLLLFLYPELKEPVFISLPRNLGGQGIVYWKLHKHSMVYLRVQKLFMKM
jgi:hypothetical protein